MKLNKRKILIAGGLLLVASTITFVIVRRTKNNKKIKELNDILDGKAPNPTQPEGSESYWNPSYATKYSKNPAFWNDAKIKAFVNDVAKIIYDSIGTFYDSPQQTLSAFKKINSKVGVSIVSNAFTTKYNKDMYSWLEDKLNTEEQRKVFAQIKQYTDSLPIITGAQ